MRPDHPAVAAAAGALATVAASVALRRGCPGGTARWDRTNHAGQRVSLLEGPAYVLGAAATTLATGGPRSTPRSVAGAVAVLGGGALGAWDDLRGDDTSKGLRGHLTALRRGRLTTGSVKIVGLAATGLACAGLVDLGEGCPVTGPRSRAARVVAMGLGGGVVAGCANVVNLLDLRPGRALKVLLATAVPLACRPAGRTAALASGAAVALLPGDLRGRTMLGDTGANAAGALLGTALVERLGARGRLVVLALVTGLTLASERVSFTQVIESTPVLREFDALGRPAPG